MARRHRSSLIHRLVLAGLSLASVALCSPPALAAGWHYYDPDCPVELGGKTMKFVAMQPKKNIDRVCDALPEIGPTVIVLDAPDAELREMDWDIRILRDAEQSGHDEKTIFRLPVQKHRNGMVNFDHTFADAGKYVLLVRMTSDGGEKAYVGRHHFTVGLLDDTEFYTYVFFAGFLAAVLGGIAFAMLRQHKSAAGPSSG